MLVVKVFGKDIVNDFKEKFFVWLGNLHSDFLNNWMDTDNLHSVIDEFKIILTVLAVFI